MPRSTATSRQLATRVGGTVVKVSVVDNQYVEAGTVVAQIDPRDYQVAVDRAQAELADAEATASAAGTGVPIAEVSTRSDVRQATGSVEEAQAGIAVADSQVEAAQAQLVAAEARLREREATATKSGARRRAVPAAASRRKKSRSSSSTRPSPPPTPRAPPPTRRSRTSRPRRRRSPSPQQRAVQARASAAQAQAGAADGAHGAAAAPGHTRARGRRRSAREADAGGARAGGAEPRAHDDQGADRRHRQPQDVEVGQVVQPGQPLMALVSLTDVWVVAELQGNAARGHAHRPDGDVEVDALGGREVQGARRQPGRRHRRQVQPAAAGERHRQLREGRAARAGEDRARAGPGSGSPAAPGHVGVRRRSTRSNTHVVRAPDRQPVDRRRRRDVRDLHGGPRHDGRQRVAAAHRRQPVGDDRRIDVGAHVVPRRQRDRPAADRLARHPLRPQAAADDVGHRLHDRVAALRPRAEPAAARRVPADPGRDRRRDAAAVAGDPPRGLPAEGSRHAPWASGASASSSRRSSGRCSAAG